MLYLENGCLKVHVLDPVADRARLGTRYCTAGSVFQIENLERTLRVETRIANAGRRRVPFQWYSDPFWPMNPTGECCRFSVPVTLPDNPCCELLPDVRTKAAPPARGWFLWVGTAADRPLEILQRPPLLGLVAAWTDYVPARLPVWGNARTFSFEPYCERVVNPGTETHWPISYAV